MTSIRARKNLPFGTVINSAKAFILEPFGSRGPLLFFPPLAFFENDDDGFFRASFFFACNKIIVFYSEKTFE